MKFEYGSEVKRQGELITAVRNASERVLERFPDAYKTVTGTWELAKDDQGRDLITLTLSDSASGKTKVGRFAPRDVEAPESIRDKVHRLVGEVL